MPDLRMMSSFEDCVLQFLFFCFLRVDITNNEEWETNTLTSALKSYFRNLPEPVLTFNLHRDFINAAKLDSMDDRVKK